MTTNSRQPAQPTKPLLNGLEDGAIVMLAPTDRRILSVKGALLRRPRIGVRLRYRREGEITLRDGRITGGDLLGDGYNTPFAQRVTHGTYPVLTVYAETASNRVAAFGVISLLNETAARCSLALFEGEDPSEITDDTGGGLGTDSGTIALGDSKDQSQSIDVTDEQFSAFADCLRDSFSNDTACQIITEPRGKNVSIWSAGLGAGMYTPYWGITRDGQPCFLAVDFNIVANGLRAPAIPWGSVGNSLKLEPASWWRRVFKR